MSDTDEIDGLIDALETAQTELTLTGHPLAAAVAAALESSNLDTLRAAHEAVATANPEVLSAARLALGQ